MSRSLQPGSTVGRFRVVSLLGAGGMGEVYLARDESLDRSVALKILPPELVKNDERVRRFIQEAKSASSLSHPNIVTIHEIGEADVDSDHVHFIAMELVAGSTLKDLIHAKHADLKTLVRYLAQAAEGIAKAHAAGIVHRDLKPENIMVTDDGYAKVLDFGLAKLTPRLDSGQTDAGAGHLADTRTALGSPTGAGMVLGTVGYMSPEQVQAKPLDHRSDIFSFGCILYEAATRQRPFKADSDIETLHQIVKEKPTAVEELNAQVPTDVRRLIRRCLAKAPDQRLQSMKDLALELAEIAEQYDTLSVSASSGATTASGAALAMPARSRGDKLAIAAALVIGALGLAVGGWSWLTTRPASRNDAAAFGKMAITRLASIADLGTAALSPDSRFLAYSIRQAGKTQVFVRQLATGRDVEVVAPRAGEILDIQFSPDSNYVFYGVYDWPRPDTIYQVAVLGGDSRRIGGPDTSDDFAISPDGTQVAVEMSNATQPNSLVVLYVDGTTPRNVMAFKPGSLVGNLAWSPDGRDIVVVTRLPGTPARAGERLIAISVKDGSERFVGPDLWSLDDELTWLPDGSGLIAVGGAPDEDTRQVWLVSWPDGTRRRITNDASRYRAASVSADSRSIATISERSIGGIWIAPAGKIEAATRVTSQDDAGDFVPARNGTVLFRRTERSRDAIWSLPANGTTPRRLTPERLSVQRPYPAALADVIVFSTRDGPQSLWRMDMDGGGLAEVPGGANKSAAGISPDGRTVFFGKAGDPSLWKMPVAGGAEEKVADNHRGSRPAYSPDGKYFYRRPASLSMDDRTIRYEIVLVAGETVVRTLDFTGGGQFQWAHSSDALMSRRTTNGVANIWRTPIDGRPAQQVTRFAAGELGVYFAWTADGSLVFRKNEPAPSDVLLIKNFR